MNLGNRGRLEGVGNLGCSWDIANRYLRYCVKQVGPKDYVMKNEIRLNEQKQQFEIVKNGGIAFVKYECLPGGMNFISTFVPDEWKGKGIGSMLAEYALTYAKEHHLKIVATCPFIQAYIYKHKEFSEK